MSEYYDGDELYDQVDTIFSEQRKKDKKLREDGLNQIIVDMQNVIGTESGRRFIWWLMSRGDIFANTYNGKALDMAFTMGAQALSKEVFGLALKANPRFLELIIKEHLTKGV